jgi:hypothetical protein
MLLAPVCATINGSYLGGEKFGKTAPVILQVYASKELPPGDSWKVYLKASDLDGDLKTVIATLGRGEAAGPGFYISLTRLKAGDRKELSGYLYWNSGKGAYVFPSGVMTLQVQDRAGNLSDQVSLPLLFRPGARQGAPPQGVFEEKEIGPIMIVIEPAGGGGAN